MTIKFDNHKIPLLHYNDGIYILRPCGVYRSACVREKYLVPSGQHHFTFAMQCVENGGASESAAASKAARSMAFGLRETLVAQKERREEQMDMKYHKRKADQANEE